MLTTLVSAALLCLVMVAPAKTFTNPLKQQGADPWMVYHDGYYYFAATTGSDVRIRKSKTLAGLPRARDVTVWKDNDASRNKGVWAPEFHLLDTPRGKRWFLYYTAYDGKDDADHRMYVLRSRGVDPMGPYEFAGKINTDPNDEFYAIDGTVFEHRNGKRYFIWCGRPSTTGQGLYIAEMESPTKLTGPRVYLEASGFGERVPVREGPVILKHDDRAFLVYSSTPADNPDYKLGALILDGDADPMVKENWKQHPAPLLVRNDAAKVYGPGHNGFFKSPDGKEDWIVFHAKLTTKIDYRDRASFAQKITWTLEGLPDFGEIQPVGTPIEAPSGE